MRSAMLDSIGFQRSEHRLETEKVGSRAFGTDSGKRAV